MKPRHLLAILLIDLIWAGNVVAIKMAVEAIPPLMAVTLALLHRPRRVPAVGALAARTNAQR